ncbi:MAG: hypothetical protein CG439_2714, partial [Methylococcaceae bacterium NSP1-2]
QIYGSGNTLFDRLNHIATHNLFTAVFDQFLKVFARVVVEAKAELEKTFTDLNNHEPHYALFLSFLKLFDYARAETNTLTQKHLDFYYRDILKLKEKPAEPSHAHLLIELAKHVDAHEIKTDELFSAGKDDLGVDVFFANDQNFVANQAKVTDLKTLYRHQDDDLAIDKNRLFASPVANSADGLGEKLTTADQSWQPFFNKIYENGKLTKINMPKAEVGFALASHYLWVAEGNRTISVEFKIKQFLKNLTPFIELAPFIEQPSFKAATEQVFNQQIESFNLNIIDIVVAILTTHNLICLVTTEKGWFEVKPENTSFTTESDALTLEINLSGADPAITPYASKTHGYDFLTNLPMILVKLRHQDNQGYIYSLFQNKVIEEIGLTVNVTGLKSLAVSNDFGSVDTSKPFQPFGALPVAKSALVIGSKEVFQKTLSTATIDIKWQNPPSPYDNKTVNLTIKYLKEGKWDPSGIAARNIKEETFPLSSGLEKPVVNKPDFSEAEFYNTRSKHGFVRLETDTDFGQSAYEQALINYIKKVIDGTATDADKKPTPPVGPFTAELTLDYTTTKQIINLNSNQIEFEKRPAKFFHLTPFGQCEQHSLLNAQKKVFLVPQFNNAEFYIGVTGLKPPQNLALFFQVADGTANPLVEKPKPHIQWSYLSNNEWLNFGTQDVQDSTDGLINSGIITFAMPDKANSTNTLLPTGQHWLRAAVTEKSEAVCKLLTVSAQGLKVSFQNQNNDPSF